MKNSLLRSSRSSAAIATVICSLVCDARARAQDLETGFTRPPQEARPWVYWFWTNNVTSKEAITREVEWLQAKGFGGAQLTSILRNVDLKGSPPFMSEPWRELFVHAVREMERCGLDLAFNPCNGWNMGGPWITASPQHACRVLTSNRVVLEGPLTFDGRLPAPKETTDYRDTRVIVFPLGPTPPATASEVLQDYAFKASKEPMSYAHMKGRNPVLISLPTYAQSAVNPLESVVPEKSAAGTPPSEVVDLIDRLDTEGRLRWQVPAGRWMVLRMGHFMPTTRPFHLKIQTTREEGREQLVPLSRQEMQLDFLSAEALDLHFDHTIRKLIRDDLQGRPGSLKYVYTESFETGLFNWTEQFIEAFRSYRGYDPTPYLPALCDVLVGSPEVTDRFLYDYRKTRSDLFRDRHYAQLLKRGRELGLKMTGQNGGPCNFIGPMDALELLGLCDAPQGEFWYWPEDRKETSAGPIWKAKCADDYNLAAKQAASAAHIYGKRQVGAEAITAPDFEYRTGPQEWKVQVDRAFCEGINHMILHAFSSSPSELGKPGKLYAGGVNLHPNDVLSSHISGFVDYLARCQFLLTQGLFVADVCYYNGDQVPNFVSAKHVDPSLGAGYDYDVCNTDVLLNRMSVQDGRIVLPDGMSYRLLALPDRETMPLPVLRKLEKMVAAGATVVGSRPRRTPGLQDYPRADGELRRLADALWSDCDGNSVKERRLGRGRIVWGRTLRDVFQAEGVAPDFEVLKSSGPERLDFIHRRTDDADLYFVVNRDGAWSEVHCAFRVDGRQPELWDAVTGERRPAQAFECRDGRTLLPLRFAPHGSLFVVLRKAVDGNTRGKGQRNWPTLIPARTLDGPWEVCFDPRWGGPQSVVFENLNDWTERSEPGIRFYSGQATYRKAFEFAEKGKGDGRRWILDLGNLQAMASVRLNGRELGIVWAAPRQVDITGCLVAGRNELEVTVVNTWLNRIAGDHFEKDLRRRFTRLDLNVNGGSAPPRGRGLYREDELVKSGLLGPVKLISAEP